MSVTKNKRITQILNKYLDSEGIKLKPRTDVHYI